ncbi:F-box/LRR-repeat protein 3 isoform X3 [Amaranthus tricolor]|uniref:F-box/LRR-repeat protein 3 isoform X3 n=1 Tax=Amaranthus tricolor TaxID=29722 RepID=UPI002589D761|nr:F-box/LRR-repeat protein 3 isoform X3 [Amaranthus tricolor]
MINSYLHQQCSSLLLSLLTDDLLARIQSHLLDPTDRKSFRLVCRTFYRVDSLSQTHLRPLHPSIIPSILPKLTLLHTLDLSLCPCVDDSLASALSPLLGTQVKTLSLSRASGLTCAGLERLARACEKLERLDVSYWCNRFGDREALGISCAVRLKEVTLDKCLSVGDVGLAHIAVGCVKLEKVSLKWCLEITDLGIRLLANKCLHLKFLDISSLKVTSESLHSIAALNELETLVMVGCGLVDDTGLYSIAKGCPSLKVVDMSRCDGITSAGLCSVIKGHHRLQELNASHCKVDLTSDVLSALKRLKSLKVFKADGTRVSQATIETITKNCTSLTEIGLSKCIGLKDIYITRLLTGCGNLKTLNLSCCPAVTDDAIEAIATSCKKLQCLNLESCNSITQRNLHLLGSSCVGLQELDLTDCSGINDTALGYLSRCSELRLLKLGLCDNISDKGLFNIASNCKKISELDLYRCANIGDEGMETISNGCKKLKKLNVSYCTSLTDKGVQHIGKLEELYVLEMRGLLSVTAFGLQAVAVGCTKLSVLDLKHCQNILDSGFWALANNSKNMREINLCNCGISDAGLWMMLSNLTCLQDAKLVHLNNVSARGFEVALRACCIQLKKLKLLGSLKSSLSPELLHFLWLRGCKIRWD